METTRRLSWPTIGAGALALALAAILTLANVRLAASQTVALVAKRSPEPVPLDDPGAGVWERAAAVEVPLSAQNITPPMAGSERTVTARALHDGERLYLRLEWDDGTQDEATSRLTDFSDAAAVQFPVTPGEQVPAFCMGNPDAPVNIWQWKASWQAELARGRSEVEDAYPNMQVDYYPFEDEEAFYPPRAAGNIFARTDRDTPVDNLLAGSFGTLAPADDQVVQGAGAWEDGRWRVVFARDLSVSGDYTQFEEGARSNVAFAVWDGARGERDGMKSVSQFVTLDVSPEIAQTARGRDFSAQEIGLLAIAGVAVVGALAFLGALYLRRRGTVRA